MAPPSDAHGPSLTPAAKPEKTDHIWRVIFASALGTMIEWYDFYLFGSLATIISTQFFPEVDPTAALLSTLATFGAGFAARPFGAVVFGRIGDRVGRKYAFLVTLLIMGGATFLIGLMPTYAQVGLLAPAMLLVIRILQGLALGGEYGGAAVYVAEHAPDGRRGFYTSFIQITATLGLFVSLVVINGVRALMTPETFSAWGWRIPFLLSIVLVGVSLYIRYRMQESPLFVKMKAEGKTSKSPVKESLGSARNWRIILTVLFGAAAGQAVVWYTGQFYTLSWLQSPEVGLDLVTANTVVAVALLLGMPFFVVFGALSDRYGRKRIMMAGNLIAALAFYPVFRGMKAAADGALAATGSPLPYLALLTFLIFILVLFVTMVYGPIAAFLVESFPARIRYTSVSVPYHVGNGYFGGFLPFIATAVVVKTGNIYAGLLFPIAVALMTFVVGSFLLKETNRVSLHAEFDDPPPARRPAG